jgi:putative DeoR family transcriptional regulator (stage III sporulation protein D)
MVIETRTAAHNLPLSRILSDNKQGKVPKPEGRNVEKCDYDAVWNAAVQPERCILLARYILEHRSTVRETARQFGVSKSTVHKDITVRLSQISPSLYREVRQLLDLNKQERHIRGGLATREKYLKKKKS